MMKKPTPSKDAADKLVKNIRRKTRQTRQSGAFLAPLVLQPAVTSRQSLQAWVS
jgi:hypothetical protein